MTNNDDFDKWTAQWEKAQQDGVFDDVPKPAFAQNEPDFFGNYRPIEKSEIRDVDADYWNQVYKLSNNSGDAPDVLNETEERELSLKKPQKSDKSDFTLVQTTKSDNKKASAITDDIGKLPNPAQTPSRGPDARGHVTPNFAGGEELEELHNLKINLEKLESKLNAAEGMGETNKGLLDKISNLRKQIDDLSNELNPDFTTDYLS